MHLSISLYKPDRLLTVISSSPFSAKGPHRIRHQENCLPVSLELLKVDAGAGRSVNHLHEPLPNWTVCFHELEAEESKSVQQPNQRHQPAGLEQHPQSYQAVPKWQPSWPATIVAVPGPDQS